MRSAVGEQEEDKKISVSSRESSDELKKRSIEATSDLQNSETPADRYLDLKRQFMTELGLGQYHEIQIKDDQIFNRLLESRIELQRKEVEEQRDRNLKTLNMIIDKCIQSDKITGDLISKILDLVGLPREDDRGLGMEPSYKKRKLASPMMSPKGHRRFLSDISGPSPKDPQSYVPQVHNMQTSYPVVYPGSGAGPTPWLPQQFNAQIPQNPYQSSFPAGLAMTMGRSREPSMVQNNENQPGIHPGRYSPGQLAASNNPSGFMSTGPSNRTSLVAMHSESPQRGPVSFLQPPQQVQPQYRTKTESAPQRRFIGHRRSQSANAPPPNASGSNSIMSPVRELQASPQKPVNFLIHTPKHPPPT